VMPLGLHRGDGLGDTICQICHMSDVVKITMLGVGTNLFCLLK